MARNDQLWCWALCVEMRVGDPKFGKFVYVNRAHRVQPILGSCIKQSQLRRNLRDHTAEYVSRTHPGYSRNINPYARGDGYVVTGDHAHIALSSYVTSHRCREVVVSEMAKQQGNIVSRFLGLPTS